MQIPTNPMYDIDKNAVVRLLSSGEIVPEYLNHKKRRAVKIRGLSHKPSSHPLDRLMLVTYKPLDSSENSDWWSVKFEDENRNNLSEENLSWSDEWYYPTLIPGISCDIGSWIKVFGHPELEIRISGEFTDVRKSDSKEILESFVDVGGYKKIRASGSSFWLHRLLALTFLPHPVDTDHLTVNHKDSNKLNNSLFNLEWATYSQNNLHAYSEGTRSSLIKKIQMLELETGSVLTFPSYNAAARYLGIGAGSLHSAMNRRSFDGRPYKGHLLRYSNDKRSWSELQSSGIKLEKEIPRSIACRDMDSGEVKIYHSISEIEKNENVNRHSILRALVFPGIIPIKRKCFQAVPENGELVWPNYPKEILSVYEKVHASDKPIKVINKEGDVSYYPNITSWCKEDRENRCDPAVLCRLLKKKNNWHDWVFELIDLKKYLH